MIDQGTAALGVAGITGGVSIASKVISELNKRKAGKINTSTQNQDSAYERAEKQAAAYFKQLEDLEKDQAELRAKFQDALDRIDELMAQNRELKHKVQEYRVEINLLKKGRDV